MPPIQIPTNRKHTASFIIYVRVCSQPFRSSSHSFISHCPNTRENAHPIVFGQSPGIFLLPLCIYFHFHVLFCLLPFHSDDDDDDAWIGLSGLQGERVVLAEHPYIIVKLVTTYLRPEGNRSCIFITPSVPCEISEKFQQSPRRARGSVFRLPEGQAAEVNGWPEASL